MPFLLIRNNIFWVGYVLERDALFLFLFFLKKENGDFRLFASFLKRRFWWAVYPNKFLKNLIIFCQNPLLTHSLSIHKFVEHSKLLLQEESASF